MNPVVLELPIREGPDVGGEYETFITQLRETLAEHPERQNYINQYGDWLIEHPLLSVQLAEQPARWIHIDLIVQDEDGVEETRITIAVRDDNVYLMGFKNQHDQWYEFGKEGRNARFIEGSTFLGCDVGYRALVGGSEYLVNLNLTKYDVIRAIRSLSGYHQTGHVDGVTVHHLVRLCVIVCECARMIPHRDVVIFHWNSNEESRITPEHAGNIKDWSKMSKELLSDPHPEVNSYFGVVKLLLNTPVVRRSEQQGQQGQAAGGGGGSSKQGSAGSSNPQRPSSWRPTSVSGGAQEPKGQTGSNLVRTRPIVEVFSVKVPFGTIGRIIVFDGKRGQIIYKHGSKGRGYSRYLALTGPYRPISAEGSFAIQVHAITSGSDAPDESSKALGELLWDCNDKDVEYNKVLTGNIISSGTGQRTLVLVEYGVWSDAVEATVVVNLLHPGRTSVYGDISAYYLELGNRQVVLFEREKEEKVEEKVELLPSAADLMVPLELRRSVIAVPLLHRYSCVQIHVHLNVAFPNNESDVHHRGIIRFFLDRHTGEIRVEQEGDILVPMGWAGGSNHVGGISALQGSQGASTGSDSGQSTGQPIVQEGMAQVNITSLGFHVSPLEPESREHMGFANMYF